jgi:hypothetical protein
MIRTLLLTLTTVLTVTTWGQKGIEGKYVRTDQSTCYVLINSDGTFKYKFGWDLQWDLACGRYELKGDSIFFQYSSDMFDQQCNSDGINYTDTSGVILRYAIDKRFRPISARLKKNKITTYKVGDVTEPETVDKLVYYYRRKKGR